jgi:predicted transcriptional regulator of viral defense system
MDPLWQLVTDFVRSRHGVITTVEAAALGIPPYRLSKWVQSGRLVHPAAGVYVLAGTSSTWHQRVRIATGSGGGWASHRAAAALWALDGFEPRSIEVVTLRGRRRKRRGWKVHESRTLRGIDLAEVDGIPCTSVVRTILDLPAVTHGYVVGKALDHACRREEGMLEAIVQRHLELPRRGRRGAVLLSEMLDERLGTGKFAETDFEDRALQVVRSIGLPEPELQYEVRDGDFVAYLDLAWPDIKWLVECDSLAFHSGKGPHEWDRQRRRRLKRLGWDPVEVTFDDVTKRCEATGRELRQLYDARRAAVIGGSHEPPLPSQTPEPAAAPRPSRSDPTGGHHEPQRHPQTPEPPARPSPRPLRPNRRPPRTTTALTDARTAQRVRAGDGQDVEVSSRGGTGAVTGGGARASTARSTPGRRRR